MTPEWKRLIAYAVAFAVLAVLLVIILT